MTNFDEENEVGICHDRTSKIGDDKLNVGKNKDYREITCCLSKSKFNSVYNDSTHIAHSKTNYSKFVLSLE